MFKTPKSNILILLLAFLAYIYAPFAEAHSLCQTFKNNDLTALLVLGLLAGWILFTPFIWAFIFWALKEHQGGDSFFGFNRERLIWSFAWSAFFAFLFFNSLFSALENLFSQYFVESIEAISFAYLALVFRAAIVFKK